MRLDRWKKILTLIGVGYLALCGGALYIDYKVKERRRRKKEADPRPRGDDAPKRP